MVYKDILWNTSLPKKPKRLYNALPKDVQSRILDKLDFVFRSDDPLKLSKKLHDFAAGDYRIRIGDYRASFDIKGGGAIILCFGHRKNFYK